MRRPTWLACSTWAARWCRWSTSGCGSVSEPCRPAAEYPDHHRRGARPGGRLGLVAERVTELQQRPGRPVHRPAAPRWPTPRTWGRSSAGRRAGPDDPSSRRFSRILAGDSTRACWGDRERSADRRLRPRLGPQRRACEMTDGPRRPGGAAVAVHRARPGEPRSRRTSSRAVDRRRRALDLRPATVRRRTSGSSARSAEELQELIEELVVPETWFFRDGQPFVELRRHASRWLALPVHAVPVPRAERPLRQRRGAVLDRHHPAGPRPAADAGSSSTRWTSAPGPWSGPSGASTGPAALRVLDPTVRDRYFRPARRRPGELVPEVRQSRRLPAGQPARRRGPARAGPPYDVIFCRNLLIYFDAEARRRAVDTLERLLADDGLLFVGHAERLPLLESRLRALAGAGQLRLLQGVAPRDRHPRHAPAKAR